MIAHNGDVDGFAQRTLEMGIRRVFALLIAYWMLYWLLITPIVWLTSGGPPVLTALQYAVLIGLDGVALVSLLWTRAERWLGKWQVPIAIVICTLAFFVEKQWFLNLGNAINASASQLMHAHILRQDFILLVLLVAWQFRYRDAVLYTVIVTVVEWVMVAIADLSNPLLSGITNRELVVRAILFLLIAYVVHWLIQRQRAQQSALLAANAKLAEHAATVAQLSASQERNRLARELHDTLAHSLSALTVQLEAVNSLWEVDDAAARRMLDNAHTTAREGLVESRRTLQALRATPLEQFGLRIALQTLLESAAKRAGTEYQAIGLEIMPSFAASVEQGVYRIVQESLENIVRHANAHVIKMALTKVEREAKYQLRVADDGIGFDLAQPIVTTRGFGIRGMQERAALFGGELTVTSRPGQGTQMTLEWRDDGGTNDERKRN